MYHGMGMEVEVVLWGRGIVAPAVAEQPLAVTGALVARARECSASGS